MFRKVIYGLVCFFLLLGTSNCATIRIQQGSGGPALVWYANTESDLAGYKIYRGVASRDYDYVIDVGNVTLYQIEGLGPGKYYYAATAYDTSRNESDFSVEVIYVQEGESIAAATDVQVSYEEIPMAFAVIEAVQESYDDISETDHPVYLPPGIQASELLLGIFCTDDDESSVTWPEGWTEIFNMNAGSAGPTLSIARRIADGQETSPITVSTPSTEMTSHIVLRISGHDSGQVPEVSIGASSEGSLYPDPDSVTPTGGAKDYLFIAISGNDDGSDLPIDYPTNYNDNQHSLNSQNSQGSGVGIATRNLNASSEDPGTFTLDSAEQWVACTVAVHPASGGQTYELSTTINGQTSTPSIDTQIARAISATINSATSTPASELQITRAIATTINASTSTSAIELLSIIGMATQINAVSSTPTVSLSVIRSLVSALSGETVISPIDLSIQRSLSAQIDAGTVTSDIDLLLGGVIELATTIAAVTQSTSIAMQVARDLVVAITGQSTTPVVELQLARALQAAINAQTSTSEIDLLISGIIELATTIAAQTQTSLGSLILQRFLQAVINAQSVTPDIDTAITRSLQTAIAGETATSNILLRIVRELSSEVGATSGTASIAIQITRAITAQINAGSGVSEAVLKVLREFSTLIDSTTLTSAIEIVIGGLGVIVDTELISMTIRRNAKSKTLDREVASKTARRRIEKI